MAKSCRQRAWNVNHSPKIIVTHNNMTTYNAISETADMLIMTPYLLEEHYIQSCSYVKKILPIKNLSFVHKISVPNDQMLSAKSLEYKPCT